MRVLYASIALALVLGFGATAYASTAPALVPGLGSASVTPPAHAADAIVLARGGGGKGDGGGKGGDGGKGGNGGKGGGQGEGKGGGKGGDRGGKGNDRGDRGGGDDGGRGASGTGGNAAKGDGGTGERGGGGQGTASSGGEHGGGSQSTASSGGERGGGDGRSGGAGVAGPATGGSADGAITRWRGSDGSAAVRVRGRGWACAYDGAHGCEPATTAAPDPRQQPTAAFRATAFAPAAGPAAGRDGVEAAYSRDIIRSVQESLLALGFQPGPIDGAYGPRTKLAVQSYQEEKGLPGDGRLSDALVASILADSLMAELKQLP